MKPRDTIWLNMYSIKKTKTCKIPELSKESLMDEFKNSSTLVYHTISATRLHEFIMADVRASSAPVDSALLGSHQIMCVCFWRHYGF